MESIEALNRLFLTQSPQKAYSRILKSAGEGSNRAKSLLGLYFLNGYNTFFLNERTGMNYLEAAYQEGDPVGGILLDERRPYGLVKVSADHVQEIQDLAEKGDFLAQYALGWMYFSGRCMPNSARQAMVWFQKSADQGFADAQRWVGILQAYHRSIDPEWRKKRIEWYQKAADKGQIKAQISLAQEYRRRSHDFYSPELANLWYEKSAKQGCGDFYAYLGDKLSKSENPEDVKKRFALYQKGVLLGSSACRARMEMTILFSWKEVELYHQVLTFLQSK